MRPPFARYWHEADRYTWMVGYLQARGRATQARLIIAAACAGYIVLPLSMLCSPAGPRGAWPRAAVIVVAVLVLVSATELWWRWPSRRWSVARVTVVSVGTAVVCASYAQAEVGLVGCVTFAVVSGYVGVFHSVRLQALNAGVGALTATVLAARELFSTGDVIATANLYVVVLVAIVALTVVAHVLAHFLSGDLQAADTDPLTGLFNRRAFHRNLHQLLAIPAGLRTAPLSVLLIDLDDFKRLNDTLGHRAGDTALVAVSRLLTGLTAAQAVVARVGGEEFVIADLCEASAAARCAARLCTAIACIDFNITASIGVATAELSSAGPNGDHALIDHLVDLADTAMYAAKHAGGNRVHFAP